jgi:hypothetical protein
VEDVRKRVEFAEQPWNTAPIVGVNDARALLDAVDSLLAAETLGPPPAAPEQEQRRLKEQAERFAFGLLQQRVASLEQALEVFRGALEDIASADDTSTLAGAVAIAKHVLRKE